ncbi:bcl-2-binding component 3, isoforms 3/4-like [Lathamus discolor]|uniref:bcl-2-binding component 3, isoforms 3/4-like n=1 Tax=Lathamus discolor TaxID=678569 RepID=UPI0032B7B715
MCFVQRDRSGAARNPPGAPGPAEQGDPSTAATSPAGKRRRPSPKTQPPEGASPPTPSCPPRLAWLLRHPRPPPARCVSGKAGCDGDRPGASRAAIHLPPATAEAVSPRAPRAVAITGGSAEAMGPRSPTVNCSARLGRHRGTGVAPGDGSRRRNAGRRPQRSAGLRRSRVTCPVPPPQLLLTRRRSLVEPEISEAVGTRNQAGNPWLPRTGSEEGQTSRNSGARRHAPPGLGRRGEKGPARR